MQTTTPSKPTRQTIDIPLALTMPDTTPSSAGNTPLLYIPWDAVGVTAKAYIRTGTATVYLYHNEILMATLAPVLGGSWHTYGLSGVTFSAGDTLSVGVDSNDATDLSVTFVLNVTIG